MIPAWILAGPDDDADNVTGAQLHPEVPARGPGGGPPQQSFPPTSDLLLTTPLGIKRPAADVLGRPLDSPDRINAANLEQAGDPAGFASSWKKHPGLQEDTTDTGGPSDGFQEDAAMVQPPGSRDFGPRVQEDVTHTAPRRSGADAAEDSDGDVSDSDDEYACAQQPGSQSRRLSSDLSSAAAPSSCSGIGGITIGRRHHGEEDHGAFAEPSAPSYSSTAAAFSSGGLKGVGAPESFWLPNRPLRVRDLPPKNPNPRKANHILSREDEPDEGAISQGSADGQFRLGKLHLRTQDYDQALQLFELAAANNSCGAQFALGFMHELGLGMTNDDYAAAHWYRMAADQGHPTAMFGLATMLSQGRGGPYDELEILKWFRSAAEMGDAEAQCELGQRLLHGRGAPEDIADARHWLLKAAEQGSAAAQNSLATLAARGSGCDGRDFEEALHWISHGAVQYHAPSMKALGDMYLHGRGVKQDDAEAARWYRLAVQQGADYAPALKALGNMYANGRGVHKNQKEALHLYGMAAELRKAQRAQEIQVAAVRSSASANLGQISLQMQAGQQRGPRGSARDEGCKALLLTFSVRAIDLAVMAFTCNCRSRKTGLRRANRR